MPSLKDEIARRRTFAIISHPDAGKTTITEKFLWYGNVIREAGHVKAKANKKFATSDWMKIEQQRGISVSSSAISFPYQEKQINLLDTPGHQDFSEDTYRALTAVDSALVLLDSSKGVETQTVKLMDVCKIRKTPVIVFMNKLDLDGRDAIELMDEVQEVLGVEPCAMTLPIGNGKLFQGVYSLVDDTVHFFEEGAQEQRIEKVSGIDDPKLDEWFDEKYLAELRERAELVQGVMEPFNLEKYLAGEQGPVFFGSAMANFGIKHVLDAVCEFAPPPLPRISKEKSVDPYQSQFSGFVFKIQANTDPKHRDRVAFVRICSGKFERGSKALHCRTGKAVKLASPTSFMAKDKTIVDDAFAGDIIGIHDPGIYAIGDTLTQNEKLEYQGIPDFTPEHFVRVVLEDPLKSKQLAKGLAQLSEEGATQLFYPILSAQPVLGVVGELQFDVIHFRLKEEYNAKCRFERLGIALSRWVVGDSKDVEAFQDEHKADLAKDKKGRLVYLCPNEFRLNNVIDNYKNLKFEKVGRVDLS